MTNDEIPNDEIGKKTDSEPGEFRRRSQARWFGVRHWTFATGYFVFRHQSIGHPLCENWSMLTELVETTTRDGVTLHGAYFRAAEDVGEPLGLDGVLLLHGVGSNFYSSPVLLHLAQEFAQHGVMALSGNTRGHDFVSLARTAAGPQRQGAAYETVGHCPRDIDAWLELLMGRGAARMMVVGHSLGAIKTLYAAALHPHRSLRCVVALSPPRLSYSAFLAGPRRILFEQTRDRARAHVEQGKPETLIRVKYPFPLVITAAGYLEKYGPAETYNLLRFAHRLPCPALVTFGQEELESGSVAFEGLPDLLRNLPEGRHTLESVTIPHASHLYTSHYDTLTREILQWLTRTPLRC